MFFETIFLLTIAPVKPHMSETIFFILNDYNNYKRLRHKLILNFSKNYKVIVLLNLKDKKDQFLDFKKFPIEFIHINFNNSFNIFSFLLSIVKIIKIYFKFKPISIYTFTIKPNLIAFFLSNFLKIKFIITFTGLGNFFIKWEGIFNFLIKILVLKKNDKLYLVFHNKSDLLYFKKNFNFYHLSNVNGSGISISKNKFRSKKSKKLKILTISRPIREKGFDDYLNLVNSFSKSNDFEFNLICDIDDKYKNYNEILFKDLIKSNKLNLISKNLNILQSISDNQLFILFSLREGLSHSMILSLYNGLPCIALDVVGIKEIIINNFNGYLIKNDEFKIKNIRNKIIYLNNNRLTLQKLSKNARITINESFSHDYIFNFYNKFLI